MSRCFGWLMMMVMVGGLGACGTEPGGAAGGASGFGGTGVSGTGGFSGTGISGTGGGGVDYCGGSTLKTCYCPDGTTSTQGCYNGPPPTLSACNCSSSAGTGGGGAGGAPTELCQELLDLGPGSCTADTYVSPKLPASILFLVDRSGSMLCNPPPEQTTAECDCVGNAEACPFSARTKNTGLPTKWDVTTDALKSAFNALATSGGAKAGLTLFSNNDACGVGSTPSVSIQDLTPTQASSLGNALDSVEPRGATPIVGGTLLAYQHLHWEATAGCTNPPCGAPGNRFVVLITDGADTCSMPGDKMALLTAEVQKARMANIRTFVIGAPGSEPARGFLSELAFQGGTARNESACSHPNIDGDVGDCHFDLASSTNLAADLQIALGDISGAALTCEFTVPGGAGSDVNVQYTLAGGVPGCVPKLADSALCASTDGWIFPTGSDGQPDRSKVILCGPACESVKADLDARVDVIRNCNPLE